MLPWRRKAGRRRGAAWAGRPFELADLLSEPRGDNEARIRQLRAIVPIEPGTVLAQVLGRYKMFLDTADLSISTHIMLDGYWEMWLTEALARLVRPGMVVADIGANIGYFTVLMADLVGPAGHVAAFEPNPVAAERMRRSLIVNGFGARAAVHGAPLAEVDGRAVTLCFDDEETGGAFISAVPRAEFGRAVPLVTRRLDGMPGMAAVQLIKLDAEGAEEAIWTGMAGLLAGDRLETVVLEWAACRYADPRAFLDRLIAPGFALGVLDYERGIAPITTDAVLARPATAEAMLVLRRGAAAG